MCYVKPEEQNVVRVKQANVLIYKKRHVKLGLVSLRLQSKQDCWYNHAITAQLFQFLHCSLQIPYLGFLFNFCLYSSSENIVSLAELHVKVNNEQRQNIRSSCTLPSCPAELYGNYVLFPTSE